MTTTRTEGGLVWAPGTWDALWSAARAAYPREACGVLLGSEDVVTGVLALTNVLPGTTYYEIDSRELLAVYDAEDAGRLELLGYFHSHPRTSSEPSTYDRDLAMPGYVYVVCGTDGIAVFGVSDRMEELAP